MESRLNPMTKRRKSGMMPTTHSKSQPDQGADPNPITRSTIRAPTAITPTTLKSVSLQDWWLVKAGSKGLAVGGLVSRERLGPRVFCSAAVAKRHNTTTLETMDGITITISGSINRSRTHLNGFPLEVCNHFLSGFPYYWTEYATQSNAEDSANRGVPTRTSNLAEFNMTLGSSANTYLPVSLDDLQVTRIRDLLMSPLRNSIFDNALSKFGGNAFRHSSDSVHLNMENRSPIKIDQKYRGDDGISDAADTRAEGQFKMGLNVLTPVRGVATRSMTRLNNSRSKKEENISSSSSVKPKIGVQALTVKTTRNMSGGTATPCAEENLSSSSSVKPKISVQPLTVKTTRNMSGGTATPCASNESHARQDEAVIEISDTSVVRRSSSRRKNPKYLRLNGMH